MPSSKSKEGDHITGDNIFNILRILDSFQPNKAGEKVSPCLHHPWVIPRWSPRPAVFKLNLDALCVLSPVVPVVPASSPCSPWYPCHLPIVSVIFPSLPSSFYAWKLDLDPPMLSPWSLCCPCCHCVIPMVPVSSPMPVSVFANVLFQLGSF